MDLVSPEIFHHFVGEFDFDWRFPIAKESEMAVVLGVNIFKFGGVEFGLAFSLLDFFVGALGVFAGLRFFLLFLGFPLLLFLLLLLCFWLRNLLLSFTSSANFSPSTTISFLSSTLSAASAPVSPGYIPTQ